MENNEFKEALLSIDTLHVNQDLGLWKTSDPTQCRKCSRMLERPTPGVANLGAPGVLGLQLPEAQVSTPADLGFWELKSKNTVGKNTKCVEYSGFLWDTTAGIELKDVTSCENTQSNGNGRQNHSQPYIAHFKVGMNDLTLVNLHLPPLLSVGENTVKNHNSHRITAFAMTLQETLKGEKEVIILGDFGQAPDSSDHDQLRKEKFHHLVPAITFTNISTKNPQGSKSLDNIWISRSLRKVFTGHWAVVREGLTNPWIPDNWSWGGVASSHCPVLAEFYTEKDWNRKDMTRNGNGVMVECSDLNSKHEQ